MSLRLDLLVVCRNKRKTSMEERVTERNSLQHSDTEQASVQLKDEELAPKKGSTSVVWVKQ